MERENLNSTFMDDFGAELKRELVPTFKAIMAKIHDIDGVHIKGNLSNRGRSFGVILLISSHPPQVETPPSLVLVTWAKK